MCVYYSRSIKWSSYSITWFQSNVMEWISTFPFLPWKVTDKDYIDIFRLGIKGCQCTSDPKYDVTRSHRSFSTPVLDIAAASVSSPCHCHLQGALSALLASVRPLAIFDVTCYSIIYLLLLLVLLWPFLYAFWR